MLMHLCILFCMHIYAYIYIHMVELVFTYTCVCIHITGSWKKCRTDERVLFTYHYLVHYAPMRQLECVPARLVPVSQSTQQTRDHLVATTLSRLPDNGTCVVASRCGTVLIMHIDVEYSRGGTVQACSTASVVLCKYWVQCVSETL